LFAGAAAADGTVCSLTAPERHRVVRRVGRVFVFVVVVLKFVQITAAAAATAAVGARGNVPVLEQAPKPGSRLQRPMTGAVERTKGGEAFLAIIAIFLVFA
jgi:hypothetical protein